MNICIYSPYFPDHTGGGEKYLLDVAMILARDNKVSIAISGINKNLDNFSEIKIRRKYEKFLGVSLKNINFITTPLGSSEFVLNKLTWTKQFDVIYYATDGSLFFSLAKKNILHIQIPFTGSKKSLIDRIKLKNWQVINTNSNFTKKTIEKSWNTKVDFVHHPMIASDLFLPNSFDWNSKEKVILHVGRFFRQLHCKKQDVLVDIFIDMIENNPKKMKGWKLVLIGSVEDHSYAEEVKTASKGFPIEMYHSVKRNDLLNWYKKSSIYWHATGYGIDQEVHPEKVEHFGISTVEAMASGCAPVVINKGGQPEVLGSMLKRLLWNNKEECINNTMELINDKNLLGKIQKQSIERANNFTEKQFKKKLLQMVRK